MKKISSDFSPGLTHPFYFIRKGLLLAIQKHALKLNGKLLDFGCGSKPYRNVFIVDEYVGLDYKDSGHDHSMEPIDIFYDGKSIPFPDNYFDSVLCSEVLEHVFSVSATLLEIKRVVKVGGRMLLTCPFVWGEHEVPYDFARYTQFALQDILREAGFKIIVYEKAGNYVETICQMRVLYLLGTISWLNKLSFPGRLTIKVLTLVFNLWGVFKSKILPKNYNLYLSNIVLAERIAE